MEAWSWGRRNRRLARPYPFLAFVLASGLVLTSAFASSAAAAENDSRASAQRVATGANLQDDNQDATLEAGEWSGPCPEYAFGATVWYKYTAPKDGRLAVQTITGVSFFPYHTYFDSHLAVFRGSSVTTPIVCNDDAAYVNADSSVDLSVKDGQTYGIQVGGLRYDVDDGSSYDDEGRFQLIVDFDAYKRLAATLKCACITGLAGHGNETRVDRLKLNTERGAKTTIECRGDCRGIGHRTVRQQSSFDIAKMLGGNKYLDKGTKIEVKVTKDERVAHYFSYKFRGNGKLPVKDDCVIESGRLAHCV